MRKVYRAKRFDIPGKADFRNSSEVAGGSQEIMSQTQAEELDLQAQGLTSISEKAFAGSPNLKILILKNNSIRTLAGGAFLDIATLLELDLSKNKLVFLPDRIFSPLINLRKLILDENELGVVAKENFVGIPNLEILSLSRNKLGFFLKMDVFKYLPNVLEINLSYNSFIHIPNGIFFWNRKLKRISLKCYLISGLKSSVLANLYPKADIFLEDAVDITESTRTTFRGLFSQPVTPTFSTIFQSKPQENVKKTHCPAETLERYSNILARISPLLDSQPNCMLNIVLDQSQKLKELDYSLPKFELPTELYEFEETLSKLKEMTSDLLSKTISCIDSELISKRECLIQNLIETEEKIEPEKLFDNICMRNIEIKESLKVIAGSLEAVTDYTSSLKIVNSLIESKEDFAPFTAKDVDSLFSAYSKMHRAFNEDHIATYGLFISVETLKDVSHSFSKEAILEQEESKKKSIRALDEQIDSFMEKLKLKESYLKEFVNFVKEETQLIESKVDDAFKLLGFKFKRFNYVLQQAKLISQAKKEEESLSKQYKEKIAEIDEKEFEIEKLKLEIKFSQRKGKAATDIQIEKLNALVESHRLLLTSKEFTQLKLKLWEVSFFIPEIILRFPEIYPLYGTKAADLPLMILEKDYNDVENMELGKKNIFLAKRKVDDKKVVLKKYKISLDNEFKLLRKWANFIGLIKFPGSISLTAIVTSTALENRGNIFLEMPYFKKGNLKNWMEANTEISSFQKGAIIHEIAKSLNILHENDIIHRDIKPENILMSDDDKPILADFDFAKQLSTSLLEQEISSSSVFQGSPGYLAPELFRTPETFKHSKASDCFAFGVIVAQLILNEFIVSLDDIHMPTPSPERDLIFGLLHPNPSKRWDLKQVLNNEFVKLRIICTVCLEYRDQENLIGCNMANDYGSSHFLCRVPCFNAYVLSFCNNLENIFMETNGNIPCISGANSCKHYFSDRMVIANCSDSTSMEYLNMKKRLLEKQIYTKFESEYQQRLEIEAKKIASMNAFEREVNRYRNIILESFNLKCPRCHLVFVDFEGCFALSCFRCGCGFCAWCLKDCGSDAHRHVTRCPMNLISGKEVFGTMDQWKKARTKILKGTIQTQLLEITDLRLRSEVYKSLEILFKEKEINLDIPIAG